MAISACPTYASKCGASKIFDFRSSVFNSKYNRADITLQKPGPDADGNEADCTLTADNESVLRNCFLNTDTCTYIIKGGCLAPGFHTKSDNTFRNIIEVSSKTHVDIQVLEWDTKYTEADTTVTTRYNAKQYNGVDEGQTELEKYEYWPKQDTAWVNLDSQAAYKAGQLGNIL